MQVKFRNRYGRVRSYSATYEGAVPWLQRRHTESESDAVREQIEGYMREVPCHACGGARLKPLSLAVTIDGRDIAELCNLSIGEAAKTSHGFGFIHTNGFILVISACRHNGRAHLIHDQVMQWRIWQHDRQIGITRRNISRDLAVTAGTARQQNERRLGAGQRHFFEIVDVTRAGNPLEIRRHHRERLLFTMLSHSEPLNHGFVPCIGH